MLAALHGHTIERNPDKVPHYYQEEAVEADEKSETEDLWNRSMIVIPTGGGKCFRGGTKILLWDGSIKNVEEIVPGDFLVGPDSESRKVTSLSRGREMMYSVTPSKGDSYFVNESHVLSLRISPSGKNEKLYGGDGEPRLDGEICNISIRDYLKSNSTFKHRAKGWRSGVSEWPYGDSFSKEIPPYILGIWLGDGSSNNSAITTEDQEIEAEWERFALCHAGVFIKKFTKPNNKASTFHASIGRSGGGGKKNPIQEKLRSLGVIGDKHIPRSYLAGTEMDRLNLLAGLIDTDGCSARSGFDYISVLPRLAEDVAFLSRSLGFSAYISPCIKKTQDGAEGLYYRVSIQGDCMKVPVRLMRKRPHKRSQKKNILWHGISVAPIGVEEYFGFEVDGPDRMFLLGDFTVVHNSLVTGERCARKIEAGKRCLFLAHTKELVTQPRNAFEEDFGCQATVEMAEQRADDSPMVFASVPSMVNRIKKGLWRPDTFDHVIIDECHRSLAAGHQFIAEHFGKNGTHITGCSATPRRGDKKDLLKFYDGISYDIGLDRLINEGYLCGLDVQEEPLNIKVHGESKSGDITDEEAGEAIEPYLAQAADLTVKYGKGRCGLSFLPLRKLALKFRDLLRERGVKAEYVAGEGGHGGVSVEEQKRIKRALEMGEIEHVCNAQLWGEGVDIRCLNLCVDLRPSRSWTAHMQKYGRFTRTFDPTASYALKGTRWPKKGNALILDFCFASDDHHMLMRPSAVFAKDDEEAEQINKIISKGNGSQVDLMEAVAAAKSEREEALRRKLEAMALRKGRLINPMDFFLRTGLPDYADYQPLNSQESRPISCLSEKQRAWLQKSKLDMDSITCVGQARKILDCLGQRFKEGKCTTAQSKYAVSLGMPEDDAWNMKFEDMASWLDVHSPKPTYRKY